MIPNSFEKWFGGFPKTQFQTATKNKGLSTTWGTVPGRSNHLPPPKLETTTPTLSGIGGGDVVGLAFGHVWWLDLSDPTIETMVKS